MVCESPHAEVLAALAVHLRTRREAILEGWRRSVDEDPHLTAASTLSKAQFIDHIPRMLDTFEQRLSAETIAGKREALAEQKEGAAAHGLQRWQQGYNPREAARDWGHLHLVMLSELDSYESTLDDAARAAMPIARRALVRLINDGVSESAVCRDLRRWVRSARAPGARRPTICAAAWACCKPSQRCSIGRMRPKPYAPSRCRC